MATKILVINDPFDTLADKLEAVLNEGENIGRPVTRPSWERPTPPRPQWGIAGEPKEDRNKIFGAGFEVDEPRAEDYAQRWQFEDDHRAFDRFVEAGEDCIARGIIKKNNAPIHKVQAIRRRIEEGPVIGRDLIGESHWF